CPDARRPHDFDGKDARNRRRLAFDSRRRRASRQTRRQIDRRRKTIYALIGYRGGATGRRATGRLGKDRRSVSFFLIAPSPRLFADSYANLVIKRERRAAARATDCPDQAGYPQPGFEAGAETSEHARNRSAIQDSFKHGQRRLPRAFGIRM